LSAAFSPDGRRIVTASWDNTARVWEGETGKQLAVLAGHEGLVLGASFSADGRRVVTASADTTARLWDGESGKPLAILAGHTDRVVGAAFSPDGRRIATASADATARIWSVFPNTQALVDYTQSTILRCLTSQQREQSYLGAAPLEWCVADKKWPFNVTQ
jgi:WD40 repeat protein